MAFPAPMLVCEIVNNQVMCLWNESLCTNPMFVQLSPLRFGRLFDNRMQLCIVHRHEDECCWVFSIMLINYFYNEIKTLIIFSRVCIESILLKFKY